MDLSWKAYLLQYDRNSTSLTVDVHYTRPPQCLMAKAQEAVDGDMAEKVKGGNSY